MRVSLDEEIFAETMVPVRADGVLSATLIPDLEWREGTYLVNVSGTGFAPHADLRVTVQEDQSSNLPVDTRIAADATGSFTLSATPPVFWQRDKGHVVVISQGPEQQVRATFKTPHFT